MAEKRSTVYRVSCKTRAPDWLAQLGLAAYRLFAALAGRARSGTTLLATERTGRRLRGLDIDPAYVDVTIERWSARTGLKTKSETGPKIFGHPS
jgi:hypothetical protein